MSYEDIITFVGENPVCTLATSMEDTPYNRAFLTNIIDGKIYFTTSLHKKVGREITQNSKIALCYLNSDYSIMLRINANAKIIKDTRLKQQMIDEKAYLKNFSAEDETFILFSLSDAIATFWSLKDNMKEASLEKITFS